MDYYLTQERLQELKQELNYLKTEKRLEVAERLKRAKELGDLSENSEYFEAREEQGQVEGRIAELEDIIKNATIIQKAASKDKVSIGSTIEIAKDGLKSKFTIVGSNEARPEAGLISNESPLGRAFLDKKAGDLVKVKTPGGEVSYKIVSIE
ncbi:MAG: transcription elongation factor GreA [Candidatus Harrisonbacteria bacterium RIFCSPHIGHO2_01_FULL_44_13]|uniref:Transcription elongation factor GreA n=1 Tax=Candidatus Harrisonbacteria bacterium RIFCSPLOWO2_01_FULL_44_18 TaxID=1798407 RepID=A0A1G1ZNH2_9BACT|nr:MAG: transcription elongation factor GreA [Candidatus Harrisonbacteria bacterium RIFCSPHIGHO2_01_FULL_44_13]OGY65969.1 MAG: transcription elongation factor GreA [Candidatus Harrisonbacteria bacterium RIFCSPLOWO2_01_FULL_44_18]